MLGNQPFNLRHRAVEIVVHDAYGAQSTALGQFRLGHGDTALGLLRGVSPAPKAFGLNLSRWRLQEDEKAIGHPLKDLRSTLDIDFQDHISAVGAIGPWSSIEIAEEFGIFKEPALGRMGLELFSGPPHIGIFPFARATFTGTP